MKAVCFFSILFCVCLFSSCSPTSSSMPSDQLKKTTKESYDALINHDFDKFGSYIADNSVDYAQSPEPVKGKAAILASIKAFFSAFPDYKITVEDIAVSGNRVYVKNNFMGTHTMPLIGMIPATGKKIDWSDTDILEFDSNGKISAHWANNPNEPLRQIGYGAYARPNTAIVLSIYEKFQKRDVAGFMTMLSDNFAYDAKGHPFLARPQILQGKPAFSDWVKDYNETVQSAKIGPQQFFAEGDDVVVMLNVEAVLKASGKSLTTSLIQHWRFRDGKAVWLRVLGNKPMEDMTATAQK